MSIVTEAKNISISQNGTLTLCDIDIFGHGDLGQDYAIRIDQTKHKWISRLVVNYFNSSLDDRYSDFCKRLDAKIIGRKPHDMG